MNVTYYRYEMVRELRDRVGLFFTAGMPLFMYLVFGASRSYGDLSAGHGNLAAHVMISMALYGAISATSSLGAAAALEKTLGWGRQLGLTPLADAQFVLVKAAAAVTMAALPVAVIYATAATTGARAEHQVWWQSALLVVLGAAMFALFGLCFGLGMRSRSAVGAASGALVVLAFLGGLFMPLSGVLLQIGRLTPLYGVAQLARHPLTGGHTIDGDGHLVAEPLWIPLANVAAWLVILGVLATLLVRRGRERA
ncbi:ABC transporter permease [Arsenicicoccus dermatophilus]|uniref:ABC transporter permease n=1 Tax=Arsenicicoccus dermatophilus TaxID=1076331 RepID=UPI003916F961